jgi:hypothetical protein
MSGAHFSSTSSIDQVPTTTQSENVNATTETITFTTSTTETSTLVTTTNQTYTSVTTTNSTCTTVITATTTYVFTSGITTSVGTVSSTVTNVVTEIQTSTSMTACTYTSTTITTSTSEVGVQSGNLSLVAVGTFCLGVFLVAILFEYNKRKKGRFLLFFVPYVLAALSLYMFVNGNSSYLTVGLTVLSAGLAVGLHLYP